MWRVLALSSTYAGNLTILGSAANIIVMESARRHVEVGFWDYAKYGIPITLATTGAGLSILFANERLRFLSESALLARQAFALGFSEVAQLFFAHRFRHLFGCAFQGRS